MEITICKKCKHKQFEGKIWYNQYCNHPETHAPLGIDPTTGEKLYSHKNDLGGEHFDKDPRRHCRKINQGKCQFFEMATQEELRKEERRVRKLEERKSFSRKSFSPSPKSTSWLERFLQFFKGK